MKQPFLQNNIYIRGQAIIFTMVLFLIISLVIALGLVGPVLKETSITREFVKSKKSYYLAEAATEDVVYRLKNGMQVSATETLSLGADTATVIISQSGATREVLSEGDVSGGIRKIKTILLEGTEGISFNYGAHIGPGGLEMTSNSVINGNVYSNGDVDGYSNSKINGDAAAVGTISSPDPTVSGTKSEGVSYVDFPPIDLDFWRGEANINNDPIEGGYTQSSGSVSMGPRRINGNFSLNSNAQLTVSGPLYITGDLSFNSNAIVNLDDSYGSKGTVIVVDGTISFNSNTIVNKTSANPAGYILFVTPSTSSSAIELNSNSIIDGAVYSTAGTVAVNSNGEVLAITAYKLFLNANAEINYDIGLASALFSTGPGGSFGISSWDEVK